MFRSLCPLTCNVCTNCENTDQAVSVILKEDEGRDLKDQSCELGSFNVFFFYFNDKNNGKYFR